MRSAAIPVVSLAILSLAVLFPARAQQSDPSLDRQTYPIAGSHLLRTQEEAVAQLITAHPEVRTALRKSAAWSFAVGTPYTWYADNFTNSSRYQVPSTCRAVGTSCYVFVEDASWSSGRVNQTVIDSVVNALDKATPANPSKGVFQTDIDTFGDPPDVDGDPKIIVLLLDIIDGYSGSGGYVAGYFTSFNEVPKSYPGYSTSNQAEIYFLDVNPANLTTQNGLRNGLATTAHEFQHMIHFNYDPAEITFVNESFSEIAPVVCGYPLRSQSLYVSETNHYLFDWRGSDNNAVLRDYSRASRFSLYLRDQFGPTVFKPIVASNNHGTTGIDAGLAGYTPATPRRFADIFQDWLVANILDDATVNAKYAYLYPSLAKAQPLVSSIVSQVTDTVQNLAARYLSFTAGTSLRITFSSASSALVIKAVEIGAASKRVLPVTIGVPFVEPALGSTYSTINFVVMNTSPSAQGIYQYSSSAGTTGAEDVADAVPVAARLEQNYPNPFNPATTIRYRLPSASHVDLVVYDMLGRAVATLVNAIQPTGTYESTFDAARLSSGVYIYRLVAGDYREQRTMTLIR